jgi:predicted metal-dependent phosphoesterase TrpH
MAMAALAAIERHPHLAQPCPDGWVRVDMHSHTMFSGDSTTTLDEIVESVVEAGIDILCVTDHNAIEGAVRLQKALDGVCRVIVGEEVRTHTGEIIGLFMTQKVSYGASAADTASQIRDQGGIVYIPHPFDPMRRNLTEESLIQITELGLVDAIEGHNAKTSLQSLNKRAVAFGVQ